MVLLSHSTLSFLKKTIKATGGQIGPPVTFPKFKNPASLIKPGDYKNLLELKPGLGEYGLAGKSLIRLVMLQLSTSK